MRELTQAVSTALSTDRWAHMMALARARRSLVACACVRCGPWMLNVIPSILMMPVRRTSTRCGDHAAPRIIRASMAVSAGGVLRRGPPNSASRSLETDISMSKHKAKTETVSAWRCSPWRVDAVETRSSA